ncbi:hypothetical protein DFH06DRAFT_154975 [Mycena polygramma]|nr:hypothetical protein DFH06DRAFT_154975 [Mycena polygramma]
MYAPPVSPTERTTLSLFLMRTTLHNLAAPQPPYEDDLVHLDLAQRLRKLHVGQSPGRRFVGNSSAVLLLNVALNLKENMKREEPSGHGHTDSDNSVEDRSEAPRSWVPTSRLRFGSYKADTAARAPTYTLPSNARISALAHRSLRFLWM